MKDKSDDKRKQMKENIQKLIEMRKRREVIKKKMKRIQYKIGVLSGKGGVGKSTITAGLALTMANRGIRTAVFDMDFHGPSIPKMLGVENVGLTVTEDKRILPAEGPMNIKVLSIYYFLPEPTTAVIWRGPLKLSFFEQLLYYADFGEVDLLLFDMPPGCLPADTMIYKYPDGPVQLSTLKPGDYIYSFNGEIRRARGRISLNANLCKSKILDILPQGYHDIYQVRTSTRLIKGTANHPVLTLIKFKKPGEKRYEYQLCWFPIRKLKRGNYIIIVKKLPDVGVPYKLPEIKSRGKMNIRFPKYTTIELMELIGYFIGNGYIGLDLKNKYWSIWFYESMGGKYRIKYIKLIKKIFGGLEIHEEKGRFAIISRDLTNLFIKLGLNKSLREREIPQWVFRLPKEQKIAFINGLIEARGHVLKDVYIIKHVSKKLMLQLKALTSSIGLKTSNIISKVRKITLSDREPITNISWYLKVYPNSPENLYNAGFIGGESGKDIFNEYFGIEQVKEVKYVGRREVYDIMTDNMHNFIADGIVVHNTGDEALNLIQVIPDLTGVIAVTQPTEVSAVAVAKSIDFARKVNIRILGVIENMSGFLCPGEGKIYKIFRGEGGKWLSEKFNIPLLGRVPMDIKISEYGDKGLSSILLDPNNEISKTFNSITNHLINILKS